MRLNTGRALGVLSQLAAIGLLLTSAWLIVRAAERPPVLYLMVAVVSVRFFGLGRAALRYAERVLTHDAAFAAVTDARIAVHHELDRVAPVGMDRRRRGDLVNRVVADVDSVLDRMLRIRSPWIVALGSSAAVVALLAFLAPSAAVVVALQAGLSTVGVRAAMGHRGSRHEEVAELRGRLAADVSEAVRAAPDLITLGATGAMLASVREGTEKLAVLQRRGAASEATSSAIVLALTGAAMAVCAVLNTQVAPVLFGVVVLAPLALLEPLVALADAERLRPEVLAGERRLAELAAAPTPVIDPLRPTGLPETHDLVAHDLVVGWSGPSAAPVSFTLAAGGVLVVTGPSGVGKSTLGLTLARLVEPVAGSVHLGGVDLTDLTGDDVRSVVGVLSQDEIVFDTTIRENLRIADPAAPDIAMWEALGHAGLGAFVDSLPRGLDTPVGEAGVLLSGGERQRLCLARLLLGGHRILVVDEPTEHLDTTAGDALVADLLALAPQRSLILISHAPQVLDAVAHHVQLSPLASHSGPGRESLRYFANCFAGDEVTP